MYDDGHYDCDGNIIYHRSAKQYAAPSAPLDSQSDLSAIALVSMQVYWSTAYAITSLYGMTRIST